MQKNTNMALKKEFKLENRKEEFLSYYNLGLSDKEIGIKMNVFRKTVGVYRNKLNLIPNRKFPINLRKEEFLLYYNQGLSDAKISKKLNFSAAGISRYRNFLKLKENHIDSENDLHLRNLLTSLGYDNNIINTLLNKNRDRDTENIENFTEEELAIIIGIILGDGTLSIPKGTKNSCLSTIHGEAQKEYSIHIAIKLRRLHSRLHFSKSKVDLRTNKRYNNYSVRLKSDKLFTNLYYMFYPEGKKVIPDFIYAYYNEISLAYQFMDDGCKLENSYKIATNCFNVKDLLKFQYFLLNKFDIKTSLHKDNGLYIRRESAEKFKSLIEPYIIDSMKYKLH